MSSSSSKKNETGPPIHPTGQDTVDAFRQWAKNEITDTPRVGMDLGKFFFSVTSGSIGLCVTLLKLNDWNIPTDIFLTCLFFFLIALVVALIMAIPRFWRLSGKTDLFLEYESYTTRQKRLIWIWFFAWGLGSLLAVYLIAQPNVTTL